MSAKILILEDDVIQRKALEIDLKELGYNIAASVQNSVKALQYLEEEVPDVLLLDIEIKNSPLDGIDVAQEVSKTHDLPIILMTGKDNLNIKSRTNTLNNITYLHKPFSINDLDIQITLAIKNFTDTEGSFHPNPFQDRFLIKENGEQICIHVKDVLWIKSRAGVIKIQLSNGKSYCPSLTLSHFQRQFQHPDLLRIHNSHIINLQFLDKFIGNAAYINGQAMNVGAMYREQLKKVFTAIKT